jgi:hypothetical protein
MFFSSSEGRPPARAINGFACTGDVKKKPAELSNAVRSTQKGPFTSTDGQLRKFKDEAEVKLESLVEEHEDGIAKGKAFVDSQGGVVLACVFYSLPTKELPGYHRS